MAEKITNDELAGLFGEMMPIDVMIVLHELPQAEGHDEHMAILRRFLNGRAEDWHRNKLAIATRDDMIVSLEKQISDLKWQLNPGFV